MVDIVFNRIIIVVEIRSQEIPEMLMGFGFPEPEGSFPDYFPELSSERRLAPLDRLGSLPLGLAALSGRLPPE